MIQYYINNRPVPRAIARHHLLDCLPLYWDDEINKLLNKAIKNNLYAIKLCADCGVLVAKI